MVNIQLEGVYVIELEWDQSKVKRNFAVHDLIDDFRSYPFYRQSKHWPKIKYLQIVDKMRVEFRLK